MNRNEVVASLVLLILAMLAAACAGGLPDQVSDTGYQGTWRRGNDRVQSTLSIVELEGEYLFRWTLTSDDAKRQVRGGWDGKSEEFVDGEKTSEYTFRASIDPDSGHLRVECNGRVEQPTPLDVHYVDELLVIRKGLVLRSFTIADGERTYKLKEGPRRDFKKVSDHVADPPDGWSPPSRNAGNPRP